MDSGKPVFTVSARDLVEFVLRRGDLGGDRDFVSPSRALQGTRGHQRLQKSRPAGYPQGGPPSIRPRNTGVHRSRAGPGGRPVHRGVWRGIDGWNGPGGGRAGGGVRGRPSNRANPRRGLLGGDQDGNARMAGRGGSVALGAGEALWGDAPEALSGAFAACCGWSILTWTPRRSASSRKSMPSEDLARFLNALVEEYAAWMRDQWSWMRLRDASIRLLPFPFQGYRRGQRQLAVAVYRAVRERKRLFASAPTGIGKTISVLYPRSQKPGGGPERANLLLDRAQPAAGTPPSKRSRKCGARACACVR